MGIRGKIKYYQAKYSKLFSKPKASFYSLQLEEILELRFSDLKLSLSDGPVAASIKTLEKEWQKTHFRWKPYYWLSTEWFHPEGTNGVAIPFYLSHPILMAIEEAFFKECEGKDRSDILKYLRHETGHIVDKVYQLRYSKDRRRLFGNSTKKYPKKYYPVLFSRKFVKNLPRNYAQTHPDEDFAETFAIWLNPKSKWRTKYSGTVLKKLNYIDQTIKSLRASPPTTLLKDRVGDIKKSRMKLRTYYKNKAKLLGISWKEIEKQIYDQARDELKTKKVKGLVLKYAKSKALTNYEMRYLLSLKHSPLLRKTQILSYLKKEDQLALKKMILKMQKTIEKKGIYFST